MAFEPIRRMANRQQCAGSNYLPERQCGNQCITVVVDFVVFVSVVVVTVVVGAVVVGVIVILVVVVVVLVVFRSPVVISFSAKHWPFHFVDLR